MLKYIIEVITNYGIEKNLSYFVIDNALDNNTMMALLLVTLRRDHKL